MIFANVAVYASDLNFAVELVFNLSFRVMCKCSLFTDSKRKAVTINVNVNGIITHLELQVSTEILVV